MKDQWTLAFKKFSKLAKGSKWRRLIHRPLGYPLAITHAYLLYPVTGSKLGILTKTFWGDSIYLALPGGLDIYLTGGKSHPSEVHLTKWLIDHVSQGDTFFDIGAHVGFYSLLVHRLMNGNGLVCAFEPGKNTYPILEGNVKGIPTIRSYAGAIGNADGPLVYYDFPLSHSEYNTLHHETATKATKAYKKDPTKYMVDVNTLDRWSTQNQIFPTIIKIDVEGFELEVIEGGLQLLDKHRPTIIMEFHTSKDKREPYLRAIDKVKTIGYLPFYIKEDGTTIEIRNIEEWADQSPLESDNIIFSCSSG